MVCFQLLKSRDLHESNGKVDWVPLPPPRSAPHLWLLAGHGRRPLERDPKAHESPGRQDYPNLRPPLPGAPGRGSGKSEDWGIIIKAKKIN